MASTEDLQEEFSLFGVDLNDDNVIDKLKDLCTIYRCDASEMATKWVAFFNTHKKRLTCITTEALSQFERERLAKKTPRAPSLRKDQDFSSKEMKQEIGGSQNGTEDLLNAYGVSTPLGKGSQKRQLTPDNNPVKRFTNSVRSPMVPFSPASFSPGNVGSSKRYSSRSNAGEIMASWKMPDNFVWKGSGSTVSIKNYDDSKQTPCDSQNNNYKYMFQKLSEKAFVLNDIIEETSLILQELHNIPEISHVSLPAQEIQTVVGRICCDSMGKLNSKSILLEGSRESSSGKCTPIDMSELKEYSLFPGQVAAFDVVNITGQKMVAKKMYENQIQPLPEITESESLDENLTVFVAAGPFTTSDNMGYEPLRDLFTVIDRERPNVCIMIGPFVDVKNDLIEKGQCEETFDEVFVKTILQISSLADTTGCQIILIPSERDVHHAYVYPQPPFSAGFSKVVKNKMSKNMHFFPNPCTIRINGVIFGITSTDILLQLGMEEISCNSPGSTDRLARLTKHLLTQRSYYPLYPPVEDINLDYELFERMGKIPITPHILIVPSDLKHFIKDVEGCCCINTGRLTKGQTGGSYCKMSVNIAALKSKQSVLQNLMAQILRI